MDDDFKGQRHERLNEEQSQKERFVFQSGYRDPIFAILFIGHIIVIFIALFANIGSLGTTKVEGRSVDSASKKAAKELILCGFVTTLFAFIATIGFIKILRNNAESILKIAIGLTMTLWISVSIICFFINPVAGFVMALLCAIMGLYYYCVRRRLRFAAITLETAVNALKEFSGPYTVAYLLIIVQIVWTVVWVLAVVATLINDRGNQFVGFLFTLSYYWGSSVISNIGFCCTSGTVAVFWFGNQTEGVAKGALKRACTTSFGSICFGSLIIAFIRALRAVAEGNGKSDNAGAAILRCLLACLDNMFSYVNKYALVYISIYGMTFVQSGKQVWSLIKSTLIIDAIINDDMSGLILGMCSLAIGVLCGGVGVVWASAYGVGDGGVKFTYAIVGLLIGLVIALIAFKVLEAGVATIFVLYAEDSNAFREAHPQHFEKLDSAAREIYAVQYNQSPPSNNQANYH